MAETTEPDEPEAPTRPGPIGGDIAATVFGLARRARVPALIRRHDHITVMGIFALVNGILSIGVMAGGAYATGEPLVFPSLGPTAFLFFFTPQAPAASPRNTVSGHAIGAAAGYLSLVVFGLTADPPAVAGEVSAGRVGAAALSLGLTSGAMVWARVPHPPAGATTLIVSLGLLDEPEHLVVLMLAVVLLTVQAYTINRAAGLDYPRWSPRS